MALDQLVAAPPIIRAEVARLLDEISRPMTARELDDAMLEAGGISRSQRRSIIRAVRRLAIIAVVQDPGA